MIANTTYGSGFKGTVDYVMRDAPNKETGLNKSPELMAHNGLIITTNKEIADQYNNIANSRERVQKAVWHTSLSFNPNENLSNEKMVMIGKDFMLKMGADPNKHQFIMVRHNDTKHPHFHMVINRVNMAGGAAVRRDNNRYRQKKVCQELELDYNLQITDRIPKKVLNRPKEKQLDQKISEIESIVQSEIKRAVNPEQLKENLAKREVDIEYRTNKRGISGVSFRYQNMSVKGSDIGAKWGNIKRNLEENSQNQLKEKRNLLFNQLKENRMSKTDSLIQNQIKMNTSTFEKVQESKTQKLEELKAERISEMDKPVESKVDQEQKLKKLDELKSQRNHEMTQKAKIKNNLRRILNKNKDQNLNL